MTDGDGWAETVTGHAAYSADGVFQHKKLSVSSPPPAGARGGGPRSPLDKGREPPVVHGGLSLRGYVGKLQAKARSAGRAIVGAHSPRLKHSTSDDLEFAGYGLMNGNPR